MFGISFWKVLLLVAVVAIVWFGYRWFQRWEKERAASARQEGRLGGPSERATNVRATAENMTACKVCGTYVAAGAARSCGRADCPFPRG